MTVYGVAIAVHVLVAVVAVGLVGAIPITARFGCPPAGPLGSSRRSLEVLLGVTQVAFVAMLLTGVVLDVSAGGAFHRAGWFKASIGALLVCGFAHARARSALRRGSVSGLERWGWTMCASIAVITFLMQAKPFS